MGISGDGEWWVRGTFTSRPNGQGEPTEMLIERVDRATQDPAQRMNYWRGMTWPSGEAMYIKVHLVEVQVHYVPPVYETTDHRPIFTEDADYVHWECRCGQSNGLIGYGRWRTVQEARQETARRHDRHLTLVVPNLRCQRCGERSHSIDYCERGA